MHSVEQARVPGTGAYHIKDSFDNHEQTGGGACCKKAATTRDRCVPHMLLRSCRDVRRPRHLPNAKTAAMLQLIQMGPRKNKSPISETPRPGRYTKLKQKKTKKNAFYHSYEYTS